MSVQTGLLIRFIAAAVVAGVMAMALIRHDRELSRLAQELQHRDPSSNARLTLGMRSPGLLALARAANAELDRERDRRLADERAQAAFQEDLASLSHDIRTPLAGAQGYLQLAQRAEDPERAARYLEGAEKRLAAMRVLVDDLFTYARAADPSWEPELAACDLAAAVTDALAVRYEAFSARDWEPDVRLGETVPVLAASDALSRVIANLLENALAHGCGAPRVRVEGTALTVENPVAPEDAARLDPARLTERFYQGDPSRTGRGTGLGLAVARALTESMGGTLTVGVTSCEQPLFSARVELRPAS